MKFIKVHGLGNDFIMVDNLRGNYRSVEFISFAKKFCNRNFGIGADGILLISQSKNADARMRLINADGSEAEMCGNGIRCVAKYLIDRNKAASPVKIETLSGTKTVEQVGNNYKVDVGVARVTSTVTINSNNEYEATLVDMGNPHCVIFVDDFNFDWQSAGKEIERNPMFPNRANVEFVKILNSSELDVKVWERGAGATSACGTGACASLAAAVANNKCGKKATVKLPGGSLEIELAGDNRIYMTGPAEIVFEGAIAF